MPRQPKDFFHLTIEDGHLVTLWDRAHVGDPTYFRLLLTSEQQHQIARMKRQAQVVRRRAKAKVKR